MKIAESRFSDHATFCIHTSKQVTIDGAVYVTIEIHVPIARSSTEEDRDVLITALMILSTRKIVTIKTCICLSPSGLLDQNDNVANSKLAATYKPCRSADGRCSHCVTALKFFSEGGKNYSSTRDLMYWLRKSNKARDSVKRYDKSMSVEEPFFGTHPNRANWCPFREVSKYEILQGLSSNIYLQKEPALCAVKALEMLATTPPQVAETINPAAAKGIHAVVVSDATEREAEAAALCAHFHFLYSPYK